MIYDRLFISLWSSLTKQVNAVWPNYPRAAPQVPEQLITPRPALPTTTTMLKLKTKKRILVSLITPRVDSWSRAAMLQCVSVTNSYFTSINVRGISSDSLCVSAGWCHICWPTSNMELVKLLSSSYTAHLWGMVRWKEAGQRAKAKILQKWDCLRLHTPVDFIKKRLLGIKENTE